MAEWIKFFHHRWMSSETVCRMSPEERGVYISVLMLQARHGTVTGDPVLLARMTMIEEKSFLEIFPRIRHCFEEVEVEGEIRLSHPVMAEVSESALAATYSKAGRASAEARKRRAAAKSNVRATTLERRSNDVASSPAHTSAHRALSPRRGEGGDSSSSTSLSESESESLSESESDSEKQGPKGPQGPKGLSGEGAEVAEGGSCPGAGTEVPCVPLVPSVPPCRRRRLRDEPAGFTEFYALWPRRLNPKAGIKAYRAEVTTPELHERLMASTRKALAGVFADRPLDKMPYPATWIRSGTWRDERSQLEAPLPEKPRAATAAPTPARAAHSGRPEPLPDDFYPEFVASEPDEETLRKQEEARQRFRERMAATAPPLTPKAPDVGPGSAMARFLAGDYGPPRPPGACG